MSDSSLVTKKEDNVDILKDNVKKSTASLALGHRWVFHQDNDLKHTSNLIQTL